MTTVVNVRRDEYDIYIGRRSVIMVGQQRQHLSSSPFGNPFVIGANGTRAEVIAKYRAWLLSAPFLVRQLEELKGKRLGCWCKPARCHGDVLAELADAECRYCGEPLWEHEYEYGEWSGGEPGEWGHHNFEAST